MMTMDLKEALIFEHYKKIIEQRTFDEYDILGFLIFIRRHIECDISYEYLNEFTNLIAHRKREKGIILDCIKAAIASGYRTKSDGRTVVGYRGIDYGKWRNQWIDFGTNYHIALDDEIIEEITLCIFSLAQHSRYDDEKGNAGEVNLFQGKDNSLAMMTSENSHSLFICFCKFGKFDYVRTLDAGYLKKPVETIRVNGILRLKDEDGYII